MNYLFISQDPYPKEKAVRFLKNKLLGGGFSDLNFAVFHADVDGIETIISFSSTMPFGAESRLVVIKKAEAFTKKKLETLLNYLSDPPKFTTMVLDTQKNVLGVKTWAKVLQKVRITDFKKTEKNRFGYVIEEEVRALGKRIDRDAVSLLKETVGEFDYNALKNELAKASLFAGNSEVISRDDLKAVIGKPSQEDIFELVDTISNKDVERSLDIISRLTVRMVRPYEIIGLLAWHFRKTYLSCERGSPKFKRVRRYVELLLSTDLEVKRAKVDPVIALEIAVIKLCEG